MRLLTPPALKGVFVWTGTAGRAHAWAVTDHAPDIDPDEVAEEDWVEDYLEIIDVEPGKIWFDGGVGPIAVPRKASDLARPGWSAFVTAARIGPSRHLLEGRRRLSLMATTLSARLGRNGAMSDDAQRHGRW